MKRPLERALVIIFLLFLNSGCANNTDPVNDEKAIFENKPLEFVLSTNKDKYELGEPVVVERVIRNNTDRDFWLIRPASKGINVITEVVGSNDKIRNDEYFMSRSNQHRKLSIPAGSTIFFATTEYDQTYFKKRGKWKLRIVEKFNKLKREDNTGLWSGILDSNTLEIEIY